MVKSAQIYGQEFAPRKLLGISFLRHYIMCTVDDGDTMDIVFLDLVKAFDKVLHRKLLEQLKAYCVEGRVVRWISLAVRLKAKSSPKWSSFRVEKCLV